MELQPPAKLCLFAGGLKKARENGLFTSCIVCNTGSMISQEAAYIEIEIGPEFLTVSTHVKAGNAKDGFKSLC